MKGLGKKVKNIVKNNNGLNVINSLKDRSLYPPYIVLLLFLTGKV